jgi:hypothetical protein
MTVPTADAPPPRAAGARALGTLGLVALLLTGACAVRGPRPSAAPAEPGLSEAHAMQIVGAWQHKLAEHIDHTGQGDPAVLARLPMQRATGTLRPARISFGVLDVESRLPEDDGFDVQGLLLGPAAQGDAAGYLFVVGIVQRQGYRPVAIADIRLVRMSVRGGHIDWVVGGANAQALARYRAALDPLAPLRFPADKDEFALVPCALRLCVDERITQAHWSLPPDDGTPARLDAETRFAGRP